LKNRVLAEWSASRKWWIRLANRQYWELSQCRSSLRSAGALLKL